MTADSNNKNKERKNQHIKSHIKSVQKYLILNKIFIYFY